MTRPRGGRFAGSAWSSLPLGPGSLSWVFASGCPAEPSYIRLTLVRHGVLFLDELTEFRRDAFEAAGLDLFRKPDSLSSI